MRGRPENLTALKPASLLTNNAAPQPTTSRKAEGFPVGSNQARFGSNESQKFPPTHKRLAATV